jgi:hypothetical protein
MRADDTALRTFRVLPLASDEVAAGDYLRLTRF